MTLEEIPLDGLGAFTAEKAGFRVDRFQLDEPWGYIYTTDKIVLRVDQHGPDYAQFCPPSGTVLFRRERFQTWPSWFVWVKTGEERAFSNFYHPVIGMSPVAEPEEFSCHYTPEKAVYTFTQDSIRCTTTLFVPDDRAAVVMTSRFENVSADPKQIELFPVMRPHLAAASLQVWDIPSLYQTISYSNEEYPLFTLTFRSPSGDPDRREYAFVAADLSAPDGAEVDYSRFVGGGTFEYPEALLGARLTVPPDCSLAFGRQLGANTVDSSQGVIALSKKLLLQPGEYFEFTMVAGTPHVASRIAGPSLDGITPHFRLFDAAVREEALDVRRAKLNGFMAARTIETPDKALQRYVNEWLPLQLEWVKRLDRGWPSGMRGTRDWAQDTAAFLPQDPGYCRTTLLYLFQMQRSDGWLPRQVSIYGKHGKHDLRGYVDGGAWVWQLLYDYLCWTKDFRILFEQVDWLDSDDAALVIEHARRAIDYYLAPENIGEHGLCKIREGDWNDSINRAGLEGRGESVMVTCQAVIMLKQAARLCEFLSTRNWPPWERASGRFAANAERYGSKADELSANLLLHALNEEGYLNSVFTDNGEWVFSPSDPDGRRRVAIPPNAYGMMSGVLQRQDFDRALNALLKLELRDGWPLFWPPIGDPPIEKLGRIGKGDLSPGIAENGGIYNHGCHGFFARGVARSGRGDLVLKLLRCMLPYDQDRHPVSRAKTAPYGVPNHWKTAPGVEGRGGPCFLSGSIATALLAVYSGMFGILPQLEGLAIDPDLPSEFQEAKVRFPYLGAQVEVAFRRGAAGTHLPRLTVNGKPVTTKARDVLLGKEMLVIPDDAFEPGKTYTVVWEEK